MSRPGTSAIVGQLLAGACLAPAHAGDAIGASIAGCPGIWMAPDCCNRSSWHWYMGGVKAPLCHSKPGGPWRPALLRCRIPGSKAVSAVQGSVRKALGILNKEEANITAAFAAEKKEEGTKALAGLKQVHALGAWNRQPWGALGPAVHVGQCLGVSLAGQLQSGSCPWPWSLSLWGAGAGAGSGGILGVLPFLCGSWLGTGPDIHTLTLPPFCV